VKRFDRKPGGSPFYGGFRTSLRGISQDKYKRHSHANIALSSGRNRRGRHTRIRPPLVFSVLIGNATCISRTGPSFIPTAARPSCRRATILSPRCLYSRRQARPELRRQPRLSEITQTRCAASPTRQEFQQARLEDRCRDCAKTAAGWKSLEQADLLPRTCALPSKNRFFASLPR